jgi:hypothetical protein
MEDVHQKKVSNVSQLASINLCIYVYCIYSRSNDVFCIDGANSFAWNADADEGANAWDLGEDLKTYQNDIY